MGGGVTIEEYITVYCLLDIETIESQVLVNSIRSLSLRVIVLVLAKIARFGIIALGLQASHALCSRVYETHNI